MKPIPPGDKQALLEASATCQIADEDSRLRLLQMIYELGRNQGMQEGLQRGIEIVKVA
jgi:hypothetical protein